MDLTRTVGALIGLEPALGFEGTHAGYLARVRHVALGEVVARLKPLSRKRMANELLAANLAHALGVRTPACFLVEVDQRIQDAECHYEGTAYCFASEVVPRARTLRQLATLANPALVAEFYGSSQWQSVVVLDALIANSDRTAANILLDESNVLWAIDHETAFGGDWEVMDLMPMRHTTNLLARPGEEYPPADMRWRLLERWELSRPDLPIEDLFASLPPIASRWLKVLTARI